MTPQLSTIRHLLPQELGTLLTVGRTGIRTDRLSVLKRTKATYTSNTNVTAEKRQNMNKATHFM